MITPYPICSSIDNAHTFINELGTGTLLKNLIKRCFLTHPYQFL